MFERDIFITDLLANAVKNLILIVHRSIDGAGHEWYIAFLELDSSEAQTLWIDSIHHSSAIGCAEEIWRKIQPSLPESYHRKTPPNFIHVNWPLQPDGDSCGSRTFKAVVE
jgi:hypothetical protein